MIEQFEQWLNLSNRELAMNNITIDQVVKSSQSMYIDFISPYYFGRITVYMVNYIDCEILDTETTNQVYYKHYDFDKDQVILLSELFHEFLIILSGRSTNTYDYT